MTKLRFGHEAMTTHFVIVIAGEEDEVAQGAARTVFDEIDRIERILTRFDASSDIAAINRIGFEKPVQVTLETFECLRIAKRMHGETGGAFDPTVGALVACRRGKDGSPRTPTEAELAAARAQMGMDRIVLDEKNIAVRVTPPPVSLDLGGIGKGYALDKGVEILREWGIAAALLHGGESTVVALGAPPGEAGWSVGIGSAGEGEESYRETLLLRDKAVSGSGIRAKGFHVIDPRTGDPAVGPVRTWAGASSGAVSDALSTAFMVMKPDEIERYCAQHPDTWALLLHEDADGRKVARYGKQ